jgi:alpha-tubulin suppressor-like RCC1 family protein
MRALPVLLWALLEALQPQTAAAASLQDGTVYAWGTHGALGEPPSEDGAPVEVTELDNAVARVAAGKDHSVVLRSSGSVFTFGSGSRGQLGHGDRVARSTATRVASSLIGSNVALVAAGSHFTTVVKLTGRQSSSGDGNQAWQLYAWGVNDWGQLGIGSHSNAVYDSPRAVSSLSSVALAAGGSEQPTHVAALVSGHRHTIAVMRDGRAYGWGANPTGALARECPEPQTVATAGCAVIRPEALSLGGGVVARAALGVDYSMLLGRDGMLWATGRNSVGQLGLGNHGTDRFAFERVPVPGLPQLLRVAAGRQHTLAVSIYGEIWAWGSNAYGELGLGSDYGPLESRPTAIAIHTVQRSAYESTAPAEAAWDALFASFATDAASIAAMRVEAGDGFSIFVVGGGHTVVGVGRSEAGQLGDSCSYPIVMTLTPRISRCPPSVISGGWQADADSDCVDLDLTCAALKDAGECAITSSTFGYMVNSCRLTCGLCSLAPPVAELSVAAEGQHAFSLLGGGCDNPDFASHLSAGTASCTCKKCADGSSFTPGIPACIPCETGRFGVPERCPVWCEDWHKDEMCAEYKAESSNCAACPAGRAGTLEGKVGELWCEECQTGQHSEMDGSTECTNCGSGKFSETKASSLCEACGSGRWAAPAAASCTLCAAGRSSAATEAGSVDMCTDCPVGTEATPGSAACTACPSGWADTDLQPASLCVPCDAGKFSPTSATTCTACAKGRADLDLNAATECSSCDMGRYSPLNSTSCMQCLPGFADDDADPASLCFLCTRGFFTSLISTTGPCIACGAGKSTVYTGATACEECPAGTTDDDRSAVTPCANCSVGQYSPGGEAICRDCAGGNLDDDLDPSTPCTSCTAGRFEAIVALVPSCVNCEIGRYSSVVAAADSSVCEPCSTGKADLDRRATTPCTSCEAGRFAADIATTECTACVVGTYSDVVEATSVESCISCLPGFSSLVEAASTVDACVPCPPGRHYGQTSDDLAQFGCVNCTAGRFSVELGASDETSCVACTAGKASYEGATSCADCPRGAYAPPGSATCLTCAQGQAATSETAAAGCVECGVGRFAPPVSTECIACALGRFAGSGQGSCGTCAPGSYADAIAAAECRLCQDGFASAVVGATTDGVCESCLAGFYADARVVCTGCGAGEDSLDLAVECDKCEIRDACIGNGECAVGYDSDFCTSCDKSFFKVSQRCWRCPDNSALLITLAVVIFLLFAMMVLKMGSNSRKTSSLQAYGKSSVTSRVSVPIGILWTELQINLTFFDVDLNWPKFLLEVMQLFRAILDFDFAAMTAPECAVQFSSPGQAYFFRMVIVASGLPFFCVAIAILYFVFNSLIAAQSQRVWQAFVHLLMTLPREIANACVISFTLMYVMLTRTAAEAFDCRPLDREGAPWRLDRQREVQCSLGADSWWVKIIILGGSLGAVCTFLIPILMLRHLYHMQRGVIFHGQEPKIAAVYTGVMIQQQLDDAVVPTTELSTTVPTAEECQQNKRTEKGQGTKKDEVEDETQDETEDDLLAIELMDEAASVIHHDQQTLTVMGWLFVRFRPRYYYWYVFCLWLRELSLSSLKRSIPCACVLQGVLHHGQKGHAHAGDRLPWYYWWHGT